MELGMGGNKNDEARAAVALKFEETMSNPSKRSVA
jgi:hypothetical protein